MDPTITDHDAYAAPRPVPGPLERRHAALRSFAQLCGLVAAAIGAAGFASWFLASDARTPLFPGGIVMKTNTALALIAAGVALVLMVRAPRHPRRTRIARIAAALAMVVGLATLSEHVMGWNLGIDELVFRETPGAAATESPNRMGPPASLSVALLGVALLLADTRSRLARRAAEAGVLFTAMLVTIALLGYVYQVPVLLGIARFTGVALHTALALAMLAAGILCAQPERGVIHQLTREDSGGALARRLLPPALVLPVALAWLQQAGERRRLYGTDFGESMMVLGYMLVFSSIIVWTSAAVSRQARARGRAEQVQLELKDRLVRILENISQGFVAFDDAGRCTYANRHAERLGGWPRERMLGQPIAVVLPADPALQEAVADARASGSIGHVETHDPAGAWREHDVVPAADGVTVFTRDVTESRRLQEERLTLLQRERAARAAAEHSNHMKDEFLATLSHELRTPLNSILGWATVLERGGATGEDVRRGLQSIERNALLQAQLIEDLLDMSRIVSGKLRLEVQDVDLPLVIENALAAIAPAAEAREIQIGRDLVPGGARVRGDPARLQQVLWNLASNAVKFTPRGGRIHVAVAHEASNVVIRVADSGVGIAPEFLPMVFDRFRQADSSSTRRFGGLGLGLSIARQLTELHGGTLEACSAGEGHGATFVLRLPVTALTWQVDAATPGPVRLAEPEAAGGVTLKGLRVLVVDDESDTRDLLARVLRELGAVVTTAESVSPALRHMSDKPFDVLVSDIAMPGADGYALIREVRQRRLELPAIALTAFARTEDRERALAAGYHEHLCKPVTPERLAAVVAGLVAGRRTPR